MVTIKELYGLPPEVGQIMSRATNSSFKVDSEHQKGIFVFDTSKIMIWSLDGAEKSGITFLSITTRSSFGTDRLFKADNVFIFPSEGNAFLSVLAVHPLGTIAYWKNVISTTNTTNASDDVYSASTSDVYVIPPTRCIDYALTDDYFAAAVPCSGSPSTDGESESYLSNEFLIGSERGAIYKVIVRPFLTVIEIYKSSIFRDEIALRKAQAAGPAQAAPTGLFGLLRYAWWQQSPAQNEALRVPQDDKFCGFVAGRDDLTFLTERWLVVYSDGAFKEFRDVRDYAGCETYSEQRFLAVAQMAGNGGNDGKVFTVLVGAFRKEIGKSVVLMVEFDDTLNAKITGEVILDDDNDEFGNGVNGVVCVDESHFVCMVGNSLFVISGDKMHKMKKRTSFVSLSKEFVVSNDTIYTFVSEEENEEEEEHDDDEMEVHEEENKDDNNNNGEDDIAMEDVEDEGEKDGDVVDKLFAAVINENQKEFARTIRGYPSHNYAGVLTATSSRLANCGVADLPKWFSAPNDTNDLSFASKVAEKKDLLHRKLASWVGKDYCNTSTPIGYNSRLLDVTSKFLARVEKIKQKDNIIFKCNAGESWMKICETPEALFKLLSAMISDATAMPPHDGRTMSTLDIVSNTIILILESFTDSDLHAHIFTTLLDEGLITPFYEKVISFLKSHRKMSPEVFNQSQGCTSLTESLERICQRYLAYKRSVLERPEAAEDGAETPIKAAARPLLLGLAAFAPERARPLAEDYAEFATALYLCSPPCPCGGRRAAAPDFETLGRYIRLWPKFEAFAYEAWFRDRYSHRNFFDPRLEPRRAAVRDFLCEETRLSELTTTFLLEFGDLGSAGVLEDVAAKLLTLAQSALFARKRPLDALDFVAQAKTLLLAAGRAPRAPEYVVAAFVEAIVTAQEGPELALNPAGVLGKILGADCEGDRERKCEVLRAGLDFVGAVDTVVECAEAGNAPAERFVAAYCRALGGEGIRDRETTRWELCKMVFENAYGATDWMRIGGSDGNWNDVVECLNETPIVMVGRYAFVDLGMSKDFVCGVVHAVTKGQSSIPVMLDLMFTKYEPAFVEKDNGNDDDDIMEEDDDDNY